MTNTIREQIILAVLAKAGQIRTANGYNTDCGTTVLRTVKLVDPEKLPLTSVWPQPEEAIREYGKMICSMPIRIEGLHTYEASNPSVMAEAMLGDIIENILGIAWTLPFTSGTTEINVGDTVTGETGEASGYVCGVEVTGGSWTENDAAGNLSLRRLSGTFQAENLKLNGDVVAATTGAITAESALTTTTGDLAESIEYAGGGTEEYPDDGNRAVGVSAVFTLKYRTVIGDPYTQ
jgi:hypothetical protein